jgi:hypothetical protein
MNRVRPLVLALTAGLTSAASAAAHAQAARIEDIQVLVEDGRFRTLIRLSGQPVGASIAKSAPGVVIQLDGVDIAPFETAAAPGSAVHSVTAASAGPGQSRIELSGVALGDVETVIYRHAVMIEGRLADAVLDGGESLMQKAAEPVAAAPDAIREPAPAPEAPAPSPPSPEPPPAPEPAPAPVLPVPVLPEPAQPEAPPQQPADACAGFAARLVEDAWDTSALGPSALCLIDAGKPDDAKPLLERLAAFAPDDWRAEFGKARVAELAADFSHAEIGYRNALSLAKDPADRTRITTRLEAITNP